MVSPCRLDTHDLVVPKFLFRQFLTLAPIYSLVFLHDSKSQQKSTCLPEIQDNSLQTKRLLALRNK